ncbi:hypothetical protein LUZ60_002538 [Juncus effusus]|nr:hypothetical protein LUZ60_002538 [Juncus effusus]
MAPPLSTLSPSSISSPFLSSSSKPQAQPPFLSLKPLITSGPSFQCHSSISEQLLPLSLSLLKDKQTRKDDADDGDDSSLNPKRVNSKATWVNPTRPKPNIISLDRHQRHKPGSGQPTSIDPSLIQTLISIPNSDKTLFFSTLSDCFQPAPSSEDVIFLLSSFYRYPEKSLLLLQWLKESPFPLEETIYYNLVMKSLRNVGNWEPVDRIAREMLNGGPKPDNITYSTVISTAQRCGKFSEAIEWFDRMYSAGVIPDEVTFSSVMKVYAVLGKTEEALTLYDRGRASGWQPDQVVFSVLAKLFGDSGDLDGVQYVRDEMKRLEITPNVVVYNTLIMAAGQAKRPSLAKQLFEEMSVSAVTPNTRTLTALLKIYGKHKRTQDAMDLWARMKDNNWPIDRILYNTLLTMCTDLEAESEAEGIFEEMKSSSRSSCRPDVFTYSTMMKLYCRRGKVDEAMRLLFDEMPQSGIKPDITYYTSLIACLGKAARMDELSTVFYTALSRGIRADDRLCGCLLSTMSLCKEERDIEIILNCIQKANSKLHKLILLLRDERVGFDEIKDLFRAILNQSSSVVRTPYCNCLIDICTNGSGFPLHRARNLFHLGRIYGLYPSLEAKRNSEWRLNLRTLSVGAAKAALEEWLENVAEAVEERESLPGEFRVFAGFGGGSNGSVLNGFVEEFLVDSGAPFRKSENAGTFVADRAELAEWLEERDEMMNGR